MYPHAHFMFGFIFAGILLAIMPSMGILGFLLIVLSTVLIDVDHYTYYVYKTKDWNIIRANKWFKRKGKKFLQIPFEARKNYYRANLILHGIEPLIICFLLGIFLNIYFFFITIGFMFHLSLDYIEQWPHSPRNDKFSAIIDFLKFRKLKYIE